MSHGQPLLNRHRHSEFASQEEFYDCSKDPHEWTNQIGNPDYASAITDLRSKVPPQELMVPKLKRARGRPDDEKRCGS